jgi:putative ABC transport system permease protein
MIAIVSTFVAIAAFEVSEPVIGMFIGRDLDAGLLEQPQMLAAVVGLALLVGLTAGLYPALYLSRIRPLQFLNVGAGFASRKSLTRRVLVVFQFAAAVVLAAVALVVFRQMQFSRSWDKGFDDRNIMVLEIEDEQTAGLVGPLRDALMREPGVLAATACDLVPGLREIRGSFFRAADRPESDPVLIRMFRVDRYFAATLRLDVVEGRHLGMEDESSEGRNIVLEQRAAKELGLEQPLGARLVTEDDEYTVVGVLKNLEAVPTYATGWPIMMHARNDSYRYVLLKLDSTTSASTTDRITDVWNRTVPTQPFEYTYLNKLINAQYGDYEKFGALLGIFSAIAIFIACLGIFSLASYATERRRREIGIRKVVGATAGSIVRMLSNEFVVLVMVANFVAWPIAWYLAGKWLDKFVHHIDVEPVLFLLAGCLALVVALLSVSFRAFRAARANPVEALRYE